MKLNIIYHFSTEKNSWLKAARGVCFEDVIDVLESNGLMDVIEHPNQTKYPRQKVYIVKIDSYAYLVPFIQEGENVFLKTIIPTRKFTKKYLRRLELVL